MMTGMCRHTGGRIEGWEHIRQSLIVIFTTRVGTRVERRSFGSVVPDLLDKPANAETILDHFVAIAEAIDAFEPRVELNGFRLTSANENGDAQINVDVTERQSGVGFSVEVAL